jgi:hypothetical protein
MLNKAYFGNLANQGMNSTLIDREDNMILIVSMHGFGTTPPVLICKVIFIKIPFCDTQRKIVLRDP